MFWVSVLEMRRLRDPGFWREQGMMTSETVLLNPSHANFWRKASFINLLNSTVLQAQPCARPASNSFLAVLLLTYVFPTWQPLSMSPVGAVG